MRYATLATPKTVFDSQGGNERDESALAAVAQTTSAERAKGDIAARK
jgi:hypothetical protein